MPPATMHWRWPSCIDCVASMIAFMPDAQTLLMVVASVDSSRLFKRGG